MCFHVFNTTHALICTRYCTLAGQVLDVAEEEARQLQGARYATKRNNDGTPLTTKGARLDPFATRHVPRPSWGVPHGWWSGLLSRPLCVPCAL